MTDGTSILLVEGLIAPEAPRWRNDALYFSDMHGGVIMKHSSSGHTQVLAEIPGHPAGLGFLPDGDVLVASQYERRVYRVGDDGATVHADLTSSGRCPINDMWVTPEGRAYVGEMGFDIHAFIRAQEEGRNDGPHFATGRVLLVEPDGSHRPASDEPFLFPNGIVGGRTATEVIIAESFGLRLTACDIAADGTLTNRRVFAQLDFAPDGICLDADGHVWVADPTLCRAVLVAEGGEVLRTIPTQGKCLSLELGGADGRTLFLATTTDTDPVRSVPLRSGRVECATVSVGAA